MGAQPSFTTLAALLAAKELSIDNFGRMFVDGLWIAIFIVTLLQIVYGYVFFRHIWRIPAQGSASQEFVVTRDAAQPVSVVICAHNEGPNIGDYLEDILELDYKWTDGTPAFEVIVVDDGSTDDTWELLSVLKQNYPHLRLLQIQPGVQRALPGKKFPLSYGIAAARHDWIICTDADCWPADRSWLHRMTAPLAAGKEIVAGYGGYSSPFCNTLIQFIHYETLHTFLQYYSFAKAGLPYMAVGRNLAATKSIFLKAQEHPAWASLPSGDDDLLIQLCATADNIEVLTHPSSFTRSPAKTSLRAYLAQKRRHVSTGKFYTPQTKAAVGGYALLQSLWWLLLFLGLACGLPVEAYIVLLGPVIYHAVTLRQGAAQMRERSSIVGWIAFFFCWMLYNAVLAPYILWKSKQRWK